MTSKSKTSDSHQILRDILKCLQQRAHIGYEVVVKWLPGTVKHHNGRQLAEEVVGNIIFIYAEDAKKAKELLYHGFVEWLLNQHTKSYRQLINKLITLFEELQYERKEEIVQALESLLNHA